MGRFFEDLLLFMLAFYLVRKLVGFALSFLLGTSSKSANASKNNQNSSAKPEGSIQVNFAPPKKKSKISDSEGEFVDYEEIKKPK